MVSVGIAMYLFFVGWEMKIIMRGKYSDFLDTLVIWRLVFCRMLSFGAVFRGRGGKLQGYKRVLQYCKVCAHFEQEFCMAAGTVCQWWRGCCVIVACIGKGQMRLCTNEKQNVTYREDVLHSAVGLCNCRTMFLRRAAYLPR